MKTLHINRLCWTLAFLPVSVAAAAQRTVPNTSPQIVPIRNPSPVKYGGTYHLSTGTWTRHSAAQSAAVGPNIIYSNTAPSGYFTDAGGIGGFAPGSTNFDEGVLPGTGNTGSFQGVPTANDYNIDCVSIGYCDMGAPATSGFDLSFYNYYDPCTFNGVADVSVTATGLPAAGGCWMIDLDVSGTPGFCLLADGDGIFDGDTRLDSFGWSFSYRGSSTSSAGFLLAGNPDATDPGYATNRQMTASNTYIGATLCPGRGTGYNSGDFWWLEDPAGVDSNCYFFGGYRNNGVGCAGPVNPFASFHLELSAVDLPCDFCTQCFLGTTYCDSNPNSTGLFGQLFIGGTQVASFNNVSLIALVPPNSFGFFLTSTTQDFVANPAGSEGNLCLGGMIGRFVAPGQIKSSGVYGTITLDTLTGEWSLASIPQANGFYAAVPGMTTNFQLWHRDAGPTSNFTDGQSVTWE